MYKTPSYRSCFAALVFCALAAAPILANDRWIRVRSQNFDLIGNASDKDIRRVATKLEQFREAFRTLFPRANFSSPVPTQVIVFKSAKSFDPYKPVEVTGKDRKWVSGYFRKSDHVNYIVLSTEGESQQTYQTIFHEFVHLLVDNSLGRSKIPPWFNEGLAEYYDQFAMRDEQRVVLGEINANHIYSLRTAKLIPLETFFNTDYRTLYRQGGHSANIFYAQAWVFMHYLFHSDKGARSGLVSKFLDEVLKNKDPRSAFEKTFQTDYAAMEKELRRYIEQRSYSVVIHTLKEKLAFENSMTTSPLPTHIAKGILGDLLMIANQLEAAELHLKEAIAGDPQSASATGTLAMVRMRQKRIPEAKELFERSLAAESKSHVVHYRYATLLLQDSFDQNDMVQRFTPENAARMRALLGRAIELNPGFPESYAQLAFIALVQGDGVDEGIKHIERALTLSPGKEHYILTYAALKARKGELDTAHSLVESVIRTSTDESIRIRAESILRNIKTYRPSGEANL